MIASRPARDAWIETVSVRLESSATGSRPARDAWIETLLVLYERRGRKRRVPHGTRGLKLLMAYHYPYVVPVASRTGRVD